MAIAALVFIAGCRGAAPSPGPADRYSITLDESLVGGTFDGRLILMFITEQGGRWDRRAPLVGLFLVDPQPIASVAVHDWDGTTPLEVSDAQAATFGGPLDDLNGPVRVQAILHADDDRPRLMPGPRCLYSDVVSFEARPDRSDTIDIALTNRIVEPDVAQGHDNLRLVEQRSAILSELLGRDVFHRAAVALPLDYDQRDRWPTIYIIPGRNETLHSAAEYAEMLSTPGIEGIAPRAVYIMLDAQTAFGHHGFADSDRHGPRATALVEEFIPHLEAQFKLAANSEARLLQGTALGGWSAIWLQLQHQETFGGCWASAPAPIDFHAMQTVNVYEDANAFESDSGEPRYGYRTPGRQIDQMIPAATIQQLAQMELAIDPTGRSGGLWQTCSAIYSPLADQTDPPMLPFDPETGAVLDSARQWQQFDITALVDADWNAYSDTVTNRLYIFCGTLDSYYYNRAFERFVDMVRRRAGDDVEIQSTIELIEGATHENLQRYVFDDFNQQMRDQLQANGYDQ